MNILNWKYNFNKVVIFIVSGISSYIQYASFNCFNIRNGFIVVGSTLHKPRARELYPPNVLSDLFSYGEHANVKIEWNSDTIFIFYWRWPGRLYRPFCLRRTAPHACRCSNVLKLNQNIAPWALEVWCNYRLPLYRSFLHGPTGRVK